MLALAEALLGHAESAINRERERKSIQQRLNYTPQAFCGSYAARVSILVPAIRQRIVMIFSHVLLLVRCCHLGQSRAHKHGAFDVGGLHVVI